MIAENGKCTGAKRRAELRVLMRWRLSGVPWKKKFELGPGQICEGEDWDQWVWKEGFEKLAPQLWNLDAPRSQLRTQSARIGRRLDRALLAITSASRQLFEVGRAASTGREDKFSGDLFQRA